MRDTNVTARPVSPVRRRTAAQLGIAPITPVKPSPLKAGERLLKAADVAARLSLHVRTVRRLMKAGELAHVLLSQGRVGIPERAVEEYIAARYVPAKKAQTQNGGKR